MASSPPHSLPSLTPLPPLEMPSEITLDGLAQPLGSDNNHASFSPAPSFADSFTTARTSHTEDQKISPIRSNPPILSAQNLRKSLSVDSFVKPPNSPPIHGTSHDSTYDASSQGAVITERTQHISGRNRGNSLAKGGYDSKNSISDIDRSDSFNNNNPAERNRHVSLKDRSRPNVRGGELPLPSRSPVIGSPSGTSSPTSTHSGSTTASRIRSGSLSANLRRRMLIDTQVPSPSTQQVTLAVVGTAGCGKSTAIRKGLFGHHLSEPTVVASQGTSARYTRRVGLARDTESGGECSLHVIEIDFPADPSEFSEPGWMDRYPTPHAVIICYSASDKLSFRPVEHMLRVFQAMKLPMIVLACKTDLPCQVDPEEAHNIVHDYDVGLVEVAKVNDEGKNKMRRTFEFIFKALQRASRGSDTTYRNPASPDILTSSPSWENSRTATPVASSSANSNSTKPIVMQSSSSTKNSNGNSHSSHSNNSNNSNGHSNGHGRDSPPAPNPLGAYLITGTSARSHSTGDLLSENDAPSLNASRDASMRPETHPDDRGEASHHHNHHRHQHQHQPGTEMTRENSDTPGQGDGLNLSRPGQWSTLDELLDKLLFLAISGDDPGFVIHFLLTYRRFAAPRSILLAMQKRMRMLDSPSGDPVFACFAQMRICHLLEMWIHDYPHDFAVPRTAGALSALIKSIISKTYLLHYGSEFLPFLEMLPTLVDRETSWALKVEDVADDDSDDDSGSLLDEAEKPATNTNLRSPSIHSPDGTTASPPPTSSSSRERKSSVSLLSITGTTSDASSALASADLSEKQLVKDLNKLSQEVLALDSEEIAQEITRIEVKMFLDILPRDWLQYTFVKEKLKRDPVRALNGVSNRLGSWVASLILCHKVPRNRVKQMEKMVDIAQKLRQLNNYSALRAFVAGIYDVTYVDDEVMEQFNLRSPVQAKHFKSWDVLFQQAGAHRAYRMALRSSKGGCIPALEVHMNDLLRAHEGNGDVNSTDPSKIHWAKYSMMGKFISGTVQFQAQCRSTTDYNFPERSHIGAFLSRPVMSENMRLSMLPPLPAPPDSGQLSRDTFRKFSLW